MLEYILVWNVCNSAYEGLKETVFPLYCFSCRSRIKNNKHISGICYNCVDAIKYNNPPFCYVCGKHLDYYAVNACINCKKKEFHFSRAWSACLYDGVIKELLHLFKYHGYTKIGNFLGKLMVDFLEDNLIAINEIDLIAPVPLHKRKLREREFNQSEHLAEIIAKKFNKNISVGNLIKVKDTAAQAVTSKEARLENVKNSFRIKTDSLIRNQNILIIDDVLTTGTTCSEIAKTLKNSGANSVLTLTLAQ